MAHRVMAEARKNWTVLSELLFRPVSFAHYGKQPFVLQTNSFDTLSEQVQKQMPGREREATPLLNHIYETVKLALLPYFLNESKFADAFARFEVLLAASYGYADEEKDKRRGGSGATRFWISRARFWFTSFDASTVIDTLIHEAALNTSGWEPTSSGLFAGRAEVFVASAQKVKEYFQQQGFR